MLSRAKCRVCIVFFIKNELLFSYEQLSELRTAKRLPDESTIGQAPIDLK